jgi:hypothetical protein
MCALAFAGPLPLPPLVRYLAGLAYFRSSHGSRREMPVADDDLSAQGRKCTGSPCATVTTRRERHDNESRVAQQTNKSPPADSDPSRSLSTTNGPDLSSQAAQALALM